MQNKEYIALHFLYFIKSVIGAVVVLDNPQCEGTTRTTGVSDERKDGEKQAAVENGGKRPLEPLTFCSCLKSSSCSTENQSIRVLISNQMSVMAPPVIVHMGEVIPQSA